MRDGGPLGAPEVIELSFPPSEGLVTTARITAASIAARAGFSVEQIEDLRLAVDELCLGLINSGRPDKLLLRFTVDNGGIECTASCRDLDGRSPRRPDEEQRSVRELSSLILDALVDAHGESREGASVTSWLRKQRAESPG